MPYLLNTLKKHLDHIVFTVLILMNHDSWIFFFYFVATIICMTFTILLMANKEKFEEVLHVYSYCHLVAKY